MIKSQIEVYSDLKAIYLVARATMPSADRRFYILALLAVSAQWGIEDELLHTINRLEALQNDHILPLPAAH